MKSYNIYLLYNVFVVLFYNMGKLSNTSEFIEKAKNIHGELYSYDCVVYLKAQIKVDIKCREHDIFQQTPNDHLSGYGCPVCGTERTAASKRHNTEEFIIKAKTMHPSYDYSKTIYVNSVTKVEIVCPKHGSFFSSPDKFLGTRSTANNNGTICPKCACAISVGERNIMRALDDLGLNYEREKIFVGLINPTTNRKLRYDFFIPSLNLIIEYDGEQHFRPINIKGIFREQEDIQAAYDKGVMRDQIKTTFALENGFNLLRISYFELSKIPNIIHNYVSSRIGIGDNTR